MTKSPKPFSIWRFSLFRGLEFAGLLLFIRFIFPAVWDSEVSGGLSPIGLVFLSMSMSNCFFEWFFHRYILHSWIFWWFARFFHGHEHHHELTPIKLAPGEFGKDRVVINRYPITELAQYEDSTFPAYALVAFWALFSLILIPLKFLFPTAPVLLGGYSAITVSMFLYEILHSLEHRPYEWWQAAIEHEKYGRFWTLVYGFHHMHHANNRCNESVGGFLGLPVADWAFGTYYQPKHLLLHDRVATVSIFRDIPKGRGFVQKLDAWATARKSAMNSRKKEEQPRSKKR